MLTLLLIALTATEQAAPTGPVHLPDVWSMFPNLAKFNKTPATVSTPATVQPLTCPASHVTLQPGDDLSDSAVTAGVTYLLPPGDYNISRIIYLSTTNSVTCYQAVDTAGRPATGGVRILVDPAVGQTVLFSDLRVPGPAFVHQGGRLALRGLLLDGQDSSGGIIVRPVSLDPPNVALEVTDATLQHCKEHFGGAILLIQAIASITRTKFLDNTASLGGALHLTFGTAVFEEVRSNDKLTDYMLTNTRSQAFGAAA